MSTFIALTTDNNRSIFVRRSAVCVFGARKNNEGAWLFIQDEEWHVKETYYEIETMLEEDE